MWQALLATAVLGDLKSREQQRGHKEQQQLEALKERWAPFTGQRGQTQRRPSRIDPIMQAMLAGAQLGQQMDAQNPESTTGEPVGQGTGGMGPGGIPGNQVSPYSGNGPTMAMAPDMPEYMRKNYTQTYGGG